MVLSDIYYEKVLRAVYPRAWKNVRKAERFHAYGKGRKAGKTRESDKMLTIQERLKDLRVDYGLTLEQLAAQTGLSNSALCNYETNEFKDISHFAIIKLAKFYGITSNYLLIPRQKSSPRNRMHRQSRPRMKETTKPRMTAARENRMRTPSGIRSLPSSATAMAQRASWATSMLNPR